MPESSGWPAKGCKGDEGSWLELGSLEIASGKLMIGDYSFIPSEADCLLVAVAPGKYRVLAKVITYGIDRRVSRLRVESAASHDPCLGDVIGETWTDTARTGLCDFERYHEAFHRLRVEEHWEQYMGGAEQEPDGGIVTLDQATAAVMFFLPSGFGDGTFRVHVLTDGDVLVGVEVVFINAEEPYPFDLAQQVQFGSGPNSA